MEVKNKLKILFHLDEAPGDINPGIAIAEKLYSRGHRIIFTVPESLKNKLISYGFEAIVISTKFEKKSADDYESTMSRFNRMRIYDPMATPFDKMILTAETFSMRRFAIAKSHSQLLNKIIDSVQPNIIITDAFFLPTVPSIVKCDCPWILLITSNPLRDYHYNERLPPSSSGLSSTDNTQWFVFKDEYSNRIKPLKDLFNKWMIEEGLSPLTENHIRLESPFLNIYNYPEEIDYCDLRPLPSNWKRFDAFVRTENEHFVIPEFLNNKRGKLIYFTMGTFISINVQMMERLIHIMSKLSYRFIVSKGPFAHRYELPENMYGEPMLPQTKVFPLIDMIIFHGGNNTLVEAFYYGKPMIVMPLSGDGYDNAQRVEEKGFGIKLNPLTCTGDELINAIEKILNDEQLMKRMKEVSERIQREAKSDKLSQAIEDIVMIKRN